jgi:hypothetical protein
VGSSAQSRRPILPRSEELAAQQQGGDREVDDQAETSTSVATNGAEALAGSSLALRRTKGSIEPAIVPNSTTPKRLMATVTASPR